MYESDLADKKNTSTQYEELMRMITSNYLILYIIIYELSHASVCIHDICAI